jgi:ribulose-bisphosphate carboxylase small chain
MRITQGTFSFLPDLSDAQVRSQVEYCLRQGWAVSVEHTDDIHPRNTYWEMHGMPMFDLADAAGVMQEIDACRKTFPQRYVRVNAFDSTRGWETVRLSFIVNRPAEEPGFRLRRVEAEGRVQRYSIEPYATAFPEGRRYRQG